MDGIAGGSGGGIVLHGFSTLVDDAEVVGNVEEVDFLNLSCLKLKRSKLDRDGSFSLRSFFRAWYFLMSSERR